MDDTRYLISLPEGILKQIAVRLDRKEKPNWKTLVSKMPKGLYKEKDILRFHMAILKPLGSPTMSLLHDLIRKKKTKDELKSWIESLQSLSDLVHLLELTEYSSPLIVCQPESKTVNVGGFVRIQFRPQGSPLLEYQWFKGSNALCLQTRCELSITNVTPEHSGFYICRVNNPFGFVFTNWIKIDVNNSLSSESLERLSLTEHQHIPHIPEKEKRHQSNDFALNDPITTLSLQHNVIDRNENDNRYDFVVNHPNPSPNSSLLDSESDRQIILPNNTPSCNDENDLYENVDNFFYEQNRNNDTACVQSAGTPITSLRKETLCIRLSNPRDRSSVRDQRQTIQSSKIPSQKVALIIGNQDYHNAKKLGVLNQPLHDAYDLASTLISMDFKVVSLANLTLSSMEDALTYFYNLLDIDTYALFYFAGHGFESGNEGYLVPVDARDYRKDDCFPLSALLVAMTKRAKLSVLLVDSCRTDPGTILVDPLPRIWSTADQTTMNIEHKNVIIGYSCCSNGRAMESPQLRNGFFAEYLLRHISKDIKIDDVLFEVSKDMHEADILDPYTDKPQIVHRMSTVVEDLRLTDTCIPKKERSSQAILWEQANIAPESPVTVLENEYISVKLVFTAEFSNSLRIQSYITKFNTNYCDARFILPNYIGTLPVQIVTPDPIEKRENVKYARICNLERLQGDIEIHLMISYDEGDVRKEQGAYYCIKEKPLYAKIATKMAGIE